MNSCCNCSVKAQSRGKTIGDILPSARAVSSTGRIMKPVVLLEKVSQGSTGLLRAGLLQRLVEVVDEDIHMESNELVYTGGRLFQEGDTHT